MHTPDFSRQLKVAGMTSAAQEALARARVIIFGAGGLAATAAPWLAAAGVGHLTIVDADTIAASNLHRQTPYTYADLGAKKATTLAAYCQARMADGAQCEAIAQTLDGEVLLAALRAHDLALDCTDSRHFAYQLNDAALITATPVVYANAAALGGQLFTLHPSRDAPCWRCLWPEDIAPGGNCDALGVLGPVPATLGLWQALEALKILTGFAARQYPAVGGTLKQTLARAWLRRFEPTALRDLIRRQFDRFEDLTGHAPAFIDGHQHVHQFPQIRETLLQEAAARYPARPALRSTRPFARDHKPRLIHPLGGQHLDRHSDGWRKNPCFGGVYDFKPDAATLAGHWQRWLAAAPDGSVIMCHPAVPGDDWQDDIKPARENEWRYLTSDAFAALWQNHACETQRWAEIP